MAARSSRATIIEPACTAAGLSPRVRRAKRLRVLLVEPDAQYQSVLGRGLAEAGFEVLVVASAEDAWEELADPACLPHLVIAETELEGMDGFGLCNRLRAELRTVQVPVFLMSSRREPFHPELAASVGADDYLSKPVMAQDVVALARLKAGRRASELEYEAHSSRLPLTHLSRALLSGARSGRVVMKDSDGFFAFRQGRVVDAGFQGERGALAFRRLLAFGSGVYGVSFGPELHRGSLLMDLSFLREQVLPALERFERLREVGVPLAARLTVDFQRLCEHLSALPGDVVALLRLFDGRRTVRSVLLECRFTEVVAFEAITQLFVLGVLVPACHVEERERVLDAPRFFEPMEEEAARVAREEDARDAQERAAEEHEERVHSDGERAAEERTAEAPQAETREGAPLEAAGLPHEAHPEGHEEAPVSEQEATGEKEGPLEAEQPAEEHASPPPAPVVLSFSKVARRRDEGGARGRSADMFHLSSGAEPASPLTADKV